MRHIWVDKRPHHFEKLGVSVILPGQTGRDYEINPTILDIEHPPDKNEFKLIRPIVNLVLFSSDDIEKNNPIKKFDPPIELRVNYNSEDLSHVEGDFNQLKLAYWNQEDWVIISDKYHEYLILPPNIAQIAEVKIWSWAGDPTIAWGK